MANSSPVDITIDYDNAAGAPVDITAHVMAVNDIDIEQLLEEMRPLGASWDTYMPVGVGKVAPIELSGLYDDAADGPDDLFGDRMPETCAAATRTLTITWIALPKTTAVETHLVKYVRKIDKNGLTKYTVTLQPTGAVTEV